MTKAWNWAATLAALLLDLVCAAAAEYLPVLGKLAGRACGRLVACVMTLAEAD